MAVTLEEFLVNVKYNVDAASQTSFIDSIKHVALQLGGVAGAATALAAAIVGLTEQFAETGEKFYWMSQRMGSSVSDIEQASHALADLGQSGEAALGNMERFGAWTRNMGPAATNYLRSLGVTATDTAGRMKQLAEYFSSHRAAPGSQEYALHIRRAQLMNLDENTMRGMMSGEYGARAHDVGILQQAIWGAKSQSDLENKQTNWANNAKLVMDQFRNLGIVFDTMKERAGNTLFEQLLPVLTRLNKLLTDNADEIMSWVDGAMKMLGNFVKLVIVAWEQIGHLIHLFDMLPTAIQHAFEILAAVGASMWLLGGPVTMFIALLASLLLLLEDYTGWREGKESAINWQAFEDAISDLADKFGELMKIGAEWGQWLLDITGISAAFKAISEYVHSFVDKLMELYAKGGVAGVLRGAEESVVKQIFNWVTGKTLYDMIMGKGASDEVTAAPEAGVYGPPEAPKRKPGWYERKMQPKTSALERGTQFAGEGGGGGYGGGSIGATGAFGAFLANYVTGEGGGANDNAGDEGGGGGSADMRPPSGDLAGMGTGGPSDYEAVGGGPINILSAYFQAMGWSREQTAGIIANLKQESSTFSPSEVGDGGLAYGIAQWHPDRQAMFRRVMGKPIRGSTLLEQAKFLQWELTHSEANAGRQLKGQTTARGAGAAFSKYYERPANQLGEMNQRGGSAERLMPQITPLGSSVGAANIGGGAGGGDGGVNVSNNTTIHVAAGPDARATASAVADQQVRVHERQVRATAGKLV